MIPASKQTVNGIRVNVVALLVAGKVTSCTPDEYRIALKVQRVGERLERKGWLPELRRRVMLGKIVEEARLCSRVAQQDEQRPVKSPDVGSSPTPGAMAESSG